MKFLSKILLVLLILSLGSCVKDVDFNQVNDFKASPVYTVSLINFEFDQEEKFGNLDLGFQPLKEVDTLNLRSIPSGMERIKFQFEAINTFNGEFVINTFLLDNLGNETYRFDTMTITANDNSFSETEEINLITNPEVFNSNRIGGAIEYTGSITATNPGALSFKSAGTFYYTIE